jgi:hypothetical protein
VTKYRLPFAASIRGRDLKVRIGTTYPWPTWMQVNVGFRLHFGWDKDSELPGLHLWADVTWLHLYAHLGGGWTDEDGEHRTLLTAGAYLKTYGLRYVGCWFGHKPKHELIGTTEFVTCDRCDTDLRPGALTRYLKGTTTATSTEVASEKERPA